MSKNQNPSINNINWVKNVKPVLNESARIEITVADAPNGKIVFYGKYAGIENKELSKELAKIPSNDEVSLYLSKNKPAPEEVVKEHNREIYKVYGEHIITGWELYDDNGNEVIYSVENFVELMEFLVIKHWNQLIAALQDETRFKRDALSKAEKEMVGNGSGNT